MNDFEKNQGYRKYFNKNKHNKNQQENQKPNLMNKDNSLDMLQEIMEINERVENDIGQYIKKTKQRED